LLAKNGKRGLRAVQDCRKEIHRSFNPVHDKNLQLLISAQLSDIKINDV